MSHKYKWTTTKPMENKQTAVEWLMEQVNTIEYEKAFGQTYVSIELIEQAKEMEKEQIVNAHLLGLIYPLEIEATKQAEQYYNETYGER